MDLAELADRARDAGWDMVELDVLSDGGELVVAHDSGDLSRPGQIRFADALAVLRAGLPRATAIDVDIKTVGYEHRVLDAIRQAELLPRTLVSTMERSSLELLRAAEPALALGLSVPRARRNYLAHPLTRPAAYAMLAYMRRTLPARAARWLREGIADAIMAHWRVVTPRLVDAVADADGELYAWTVDDPSRLEALERLGVNGVITNHLARAATSVASASRAAGAASGASASRAAPGGA